MKAILSVIALCAVLACGCKTATLEPGGPYAPTNSVGQVLYNDAGLALADASYKMAYDTMFAVFKLERDNRQAIWDISPTVKRALDGIRPQVVEIDRRWAAARKLYKAAPTPAGLSTLQTILAEIQRLLPVVQDQLVPVNATLTKQN